MSINEYFESVKDYILADSSVADLKHFPQLENAPHHVHVGEQFFPGSPVNIFSVLDEITSLFRE